MGGTWSGSAGAAAHLSASQTSRRRVRSAAPVLRSGAAHHVRASGRGGTAWQHGLAGAVPSAPAANQEAPAPQARPCPAGALTSSPRRELLQLAAARAHRRRIAAKRLLCTAGRGGAPARHAEHPVNNRLLIGAQLPLLLAGLCFRGLARAPLTLLRTPLCIVGPLPQLVQLGGVSVLVTAGQQGQRPQLAAAGCAPTGGLHTDRHMP